MFCVFFLVFWFFLGSYIFSYGDVLNYFEVFVCYLIELNFGKILLFFDFLLIFLFREIFCVSVGDNFF